MKKDSITLQRKGSYILVILVLFIILILSVFLGILFGNADLTFRQVYGVLAYELTHASYFSSYGTGAIHDVVWIIRAPRIILAAEIGMGLAVSGAIMQAIVKNPLADPYILGISSGASLGATVAILFGIGKILGSDFVGVMAFLGAFTSAICVVFIANTGRFKSTGKLILAGMAVNAVCSSFSNFALYMANDRNSTAEVTYWMFGSLSGAQWHKVGLLLPIFLVSIVFLWMQARNLNLMLLGDDTATTLGSDLQKIRIVYLGIISVVVGLSVYAAGMIGFVGLIIPHVVRMFIGIDYKKMIPICALLGAIFLIWSDVVSRIILENSEMPIGILVSMLGAPCFIYLMLTKSYGFGGGER